MGVVGANPDELDALASRLESSADEMWSIRGTLSPQIYHSPWNGRNADRFRNRWSNEYAVALDRAANYLKDAGSTLRRQAQEQRVVSRASSGSGFVGSGPPGTADDQQSDRLRDFLESIGLTADQIKDLLGLLGSMKEILEWLNVLLENEALRDFLEAAGKVLDIVDVIANFAKDLGEHSHLPHDEALVHAIVETGARYAASQGLKEASKLLAAAILGAVVPVGGHVAGQVIGFLVGIALSEGAGWVDGQFGVFDGAADKAVESYRYLKERDFNMVNVISDGVSNVWDGAKAIGDVLNPWD